VRNVAWNDFISQIKFLPDDSPQDSLDKEMFVVQKFLKAHETEVRVGIYDVEVFRAIDQARARLQKADRDLGNGTKRALLQGRASKAWEVTCEIQNSGHLQQVPAAIVSGEGFGYVCFKIPGKEGYHFFHRRFRSEDCWEAYMRESRQK